MPYRALSRALSVTVTVPSLSMRHCVGLTDRGDVSLSLAASMWRQRLPSGVLRSSDGMVLVAICCMICSMMRSLLFFMGSLDSKCYCLPQPVTVYQLVVASFAILQSIAMLVKRGIKIDNLTQFQVLYRYVEASSKFLFLVLWTATGSGVLLIVYA